MLKIIAVTIAAATIGVGWGLTTADSAPAPGAAASAQENQEERSPTTKPADSYPLAVCVISGEKLGSMGEPIVKEYDGRTVKFCCAGCVAAFEKDPAASHKKMDEMIIAAGKADYPLETCVVSGEELGSMGEPINFVHRPTNTLVRLCCRGCVKAYEENPKEYVEKVKAAKAEKDAKAERDAADEQ